MENYETNFPGQEPEFNPQPSAPFDAAPQNASPFADSPDVMQQPPYFENSFIPPEAPKSPSKKPGKVWKSILACVLAVALIAAGCGITAFSVNSYWQGKYNRAEELLGSLQDKIEDLQQQVNDNSYTGNGNSISGSTNTSHSGMTPGQVYAKCVDSVVAISSTIGNQGTSSGSGFIISEDGYILSNHHVVEGATSVSVTTHSGQTYSAKVMGSDSNNDLALLKIEATGLKYVSLGSSDDLIVGDQVVAIGHPLGSETATLTVGYISAKDQSVATDGSILNMLQTDAAINSGNSGGPLFNMKGEVIGITTAKYSGTSSSGASIESIGFAIPMDDVLDKIQELINNGYVSSPYMGISVDNRMGIGAYVVSVEPGSSAQNAGIRAGDIIIALGEHDIESVADISQAMRSFKVGDTTTVSVFRGRQILDLNITFAEKPHSNQSSTQTPTGGTNMPSDGDYQDWWDYFFGDGNNG